jgi:hypothetical protein
VCAGQHCCGAPKRNSDRVTDDVIARSKNSLADNNYTLRYRKPRIEAAVGLLIGNHTVLIGTSRRLERIPTLRDIFFIIIYRIHFPVNHSEHAISVILPRKSSSNSPTWISQLAAQRASKLAELNIRVISIKLQIAIVYARLYEPMILWKVATLSVLLYARRG